MIKQLFLLIFLSASIAFAQDYSTYAPKDRYLLDSVDLSTYSEHDRTLLEENLDRYHQSELDTGKINAIGEICQYMNHEDWIRYQVLMSDLIEEARDKDVEGKYTLFLDLAYAHTLTNLGFIARQFGQIEEAIAYNEESLEMFKTLQEPDGAITVCLNLASLLESLGDLENAIKYLNVTERLCLMVGDSLSLSYVYMSFGVMHSTLLNSQTALNYFQQSLDLRKLLGSEDEVADCYHNMADVYYDMGNYDRAFEQYKKAKEIAVRTGDLYSKALVHHNIALVYYDLGETEIAWQEIDSAKNISEEYGLVQILSTSLITMGKFALKEKRFKDAQAFALQGQSIASEIGTPPEIMQSALVLSKTYPEHNQWKEGYKNLETYYKYRDSLKGIVNQKAAIQQDMEHQFEKKHITDSLNFQRQKEFNDLAHKSDITKQNQQKTGLAIGLGFCLILGAFAYRGYQRKKKANDIISAQKEEVEIQKDVIEEAHEEIKNSIEYAKRIQTAILPPQKLVKEYLKDSFVLYEPKDIVAGDFYWMEPKSDKILFAAADCTGHGVPGAMVSVICNNGLNRAVREFGLDVPGQILDKTRELVIQEFEKSEEEVKDGMDIAICSLEKNPSNGAVSLQYAGAHNPLWVVRKGTNEVEEIKANKQPIGQFDNLIPYTTHKLELSKGDTIYIFSDGFVDQFGGEKGKKFKSKNFKTLLLSIQELQMEEQQERLKKVFNDWRGTIEQVDDVCVVGVRI